MRCPSKSSTTELGVDVTRFPVSTFVDQELQLQPETTPVTIPLPLVQKVLQRTRRGPSGGVFSTNGRAGFLSSGLFCKKAVTLVDMTLEIPSIPVAVTVRT